MDNQQFERLDARLDAIVRLLAAPMIQDRPIAESAPMLSQLGLDNNTIAAVCNTSPSVIRTALLRARKSRAKRKPTAGTP